MAHYKGPFHPIQGYHVERGRRGGLFWRFTLVCGHTVRRRVTRNRARYDADDEPVPTYTRLLCRRCKQEHWEEMVEQLNGG